LASPPAKDKELHDTMGKSPPPPPAQDLNLHPSTEQLELLPNTHRETHKPLPSTQQSVFDACKDSSSSGFLFSSRKFRTSIRTLVDKCFKLLNHSEKEVVVDEPSKDMTTVVSKVFSSHKNINTRNH
jgi:hypothetical protein